MIKNKDISEDDVRIKNSKHTEKLISVHFTEKLFTVLPEILLHDDPEAFPQLVGSHLDMKSPALELIKYFCQVLSLIPNMENAVQCLKRSLLKLVHMSEYAGGSL